MFRNAFWSNLAAGIFVAAACARFSAPAAARPLVWAMPPGNGDGHEIRELFTQPDDWRQARSRIDVLGFADHALGAFSDAELQAWLPHIRRWGLKLSLEVGAIKKWGPTGALAFAAGRKNWDRFIADGGEINDIAMDEPLRVSIKVLNEDRDYAVAETARFMALVRQAYPAVQIGDIEAYPGFDSREIVSFIDALQAKLRTMGVRGLDFFSLDVNWVQFDRPGAGGSWQGVHWLEAECHARGIPFNLIYWAADYPLLKRRGLATTVTWEASIMRQGQAYAAENGAPDAYVIESWLGFPDHAVPETDPDFMHSVLNFTNTFVPSRPAR